jgi:hypothetical protein
MSDCGFCKDEDLVDESDHGVRSLAMLIHIRRWWRGIRRRSRWPMEWEGWQGLISGFRKMLGMEAQDVLPKGENRRWSDIDNPDRLN